MPVYQCGTQTDYLDAGQRDRLAKGITRIHSEETNAPEPFIRVVFTEQDPGYVYTAGEPAGSVIVHGSIRAGRTQETRETIMRRIHDLVVEVTGAPIETIVIAIMDFPSQWGMEAGFVIPEPTPEAEAEWLRQLQESGAV